MSMDSRQLITVIYEIQYSAEYSGVLIRRGMHLTPNKFMK